MKGLNNFFHLDQSVNSLSDQLVNAEIHIIVLPTCSTLLLTVRFPFVDKFHSFNLFSNSLSDMTLYTSFGRGFLL